MDVVMCLSPLWAMFAFSGWRHPIRRFPVPQDLASLARLRKESAIRQRQSVRWNKDAQVITAPLLFPQLDK